MAQQRKITCDCGGHLQEQDMELDHILTKAMVCDACQFTTLTKEQAKEFRKRVEFHQAIDQEKQVIQIGNSMGITLPEKLRDYGVSIGKKLRIEAIDDKSFKVEIV
ncbi:hypothetical protein HYU19_01005 [Candidatus Woesearchaeota archaeon]|nr:hypothetical protein [Candidatus Woesearchaeota archaeon]